jgi:hypothetical protein
MPRLALLPCEKPLRMLLLHFPKQPATGWSRGPHRRVDEAQVANPFQSSLTKR